MSNPINEDTCMDTELLPLELTKLAAQAADHLTNAREHGRISVDSFWEFGDSLTQLRAKCAHGEWGPLLTSFSISRTTAHTAMKLRARFNKRDALIHAGHTSVRAALADMPITRPERIESHDPDEPIINHVPSTLREEKERTAPPPPPPVRPISDVVLPPPNVPHAEQIDLVATCNAVPPSEPKPEPEVPPAPKEPAVDYTDVLFAIHHLESALACMETLRQTNVHPGEHASNMAIYSYKVRAAVCDYLRSHDLPRYIS